MLTSVSLHNFKCLRKTDGISLSSINLLTGVNGEGKSSFIHALLLLSQTWSKGNYDIIAPNEASLINLGVFQDVLSFDARPKVMDINLTFDGKDGGVFELQYDANEQNPQYGELCGLRYNGKEMLADASEMVGADEEPLDTNTAIPVMTLDSYPALMSLKRIFYVAASRNAARGILSKKQFENEDKLDPDGLNVPQMIAKLTPDNIAILEEYMDRIFEGATVKVDEDEERYRLRLDSHTNSDHLFTPVNVGYGYSYVLLMITSLVMAQKGDYVIIENPEAHLHPSAQAEVMKIIAEVSKNKGAQIFIETHSDHIVNGAQVAVNKKVLAAQDLSILFFNKGLVQNLQLTDRGHIINPPQKFCDQYTKDLDILFDDINVLWG